jgi:hypothetical protein
MGIIGVINSFTMVNIRFRLFRFATKLTYSNTFIEILTSD